MDRRRVVVSVTAVLVASLGVLLVVLRWDDANKVAAVVSALAAVAGVGVAIFAALPIARPPRSGGGGWRVSRSGSATAGRGGNAVSGIAGRADALPDEIRVDQSGNVRTGKDGASVSGISGD